MDSEDMNKENLNLGIRWCVTTTNVQEILKKDGYEFLDYTGDKDNTRWGSKIELFKKNNPKNLNISLENMKISCKDLAGDLNYKKTFNKSMDLSKEYCSEKRK